MVQCDGSYSITEGTGKKLIWRQSKVAVTRGLSSSYSNCLVNQRTSIKDLILLFCVCVITHNDAERTLLKNSALNTTLSLKIWLINQHRSKDLVQLYFCVKHAWLINEHRSKRPPTIEFVCAIWYSVFTEYLWRILH